MKHPFVIKKIKRLPKWTQQEDDQLIKAVQHQGQQDWIEISNIINNKTSYQCSLRYQIISPTRKKGKWDKEEDRHILAAVEEHGPKWNEIAKTFPNRNAKQIRNRYINYLDPNISQERFTTAEDIAILDMYNVYGGRWKLIKQYLPNRSSDMIKNRFVYHISKNVKLLNVLKTLYITKDKLNETLTDLTI
jgi:hypothetical protein